MAILHRTAHGGVTHVLLHEGHLWDREKISNPVSAVTGVENGTRLSLAGVVASPPLGQKAGGGVPPPDARNRGPRTTSRPEPDDRWRRGTDP